MQALRASDLGKPSKSVSRDEDAETKICFTSPNEEGGFEDRQTLKAGMGCLDVSSQPQAGTSK